MKSTNTNTAKKEGSKQTGTTTINTNYKKTKARNARIKTENTNTAKEEGSCDTENAANKQGRPPGGLWRHWDNCRPALLFNFNLRVRCVQRCIHSICFSKIARISAGCVYFWASVELQLCWVQNAQYAIIAYNQIRLYYLILTYYFLLLSTLLVLFGMYFWCLSCTNA